MIKRITIKKIIITAVAAAFMLSASSTAFSAGEILKPYTLESAMTTAVANNSSLKLYQEKIKIAERKYNDALNDAKDMPGKNWATPAERIVNAKKEFLAPLQRLSELNELKWQKLDAENSLRLDVKKLYYQIQIKKQKLALQAAAIKRAQDDYAKKQQEVKLGRAKETDLLSVEIAVDEAETTLSELQRDMDKLVMNLNIKLGLDIALKTTLADTAIPKTDYTADPTKLAESMLASAHSLKKLADSKALKEKELYIVENYAIGDRPEEADTLAADIVNFDFAVRDEKVAIEVKIRSDYNSLLNLKDDIQLKKLDIDKYTKLLSVAKVRLDKGLITNAAYQKAVGDRDNVGAAYDSALADYYIAVETFKNYTTPINIK